LLEAGADIFAQTSDGDTCLHQAAFHNHFDALVNLLVRPDARRPIPEERILSWWRGLTGTKEDPLRLVDMRKHDGSTALHIAAATNAVAAVQVLLEHGAKKEVSQWVVKCEANRLKAFPCRASIVQAKLPIS
jgi:ankyrin repeat protein